MGSPTITVVMSIYNEPEEWLKDSIESILHQTFVDLEFIIVNDNPDRALNGQIIDRFKIADNRIIRLENPRNIGLTSSLNIAFKETRGKYIARMDADDIALPKRLEIQFKFMEKNPSIGVCGAWIHYFGAINLLSAKINKLPLTPKDIKTTFAFFNPLVHPTAFLRKESLDCTQILYDEQFRNAQDYLLWEKLLDHSIQLANVGKVLLHYRVSKEQISNKLKNNQNIIANAIQLRALDKMGFTLAASEKELYLRLMNRENLNSNELFDRAENLLLRLRSTMTPNKDFNSELVEKTIHGEWVSCFLNARLEIRPWKQFFASPLFRIQYFCLRDVAKIILKR